MLNIFSKAAERRAADLQAECRDIVRELVRLHGGKQAAAFPDVARATGLSPRRIRSHWHGEVQLGAVAAHEIDALRDALVAALEAEERRAAHRAAIWRARFERSGTAVSRGHGEGVVHAAACPA